MKNPFKDLFKKKRKEGDARVPWIAGAKKKTSFFDKYLKNRLGKSAVQGEEIVGVELNANEIRLAQLSNNKSNQWILDRFFVHKIEGLPEDASVLENPDKKADELKLALQKSKISTKSQSKQAN